MFDFKYSEAPSADLGLPICELIMEYEESEIEFYKKYNFCNSALYYKLISPYGEFIFNLEILGGALLD